MVVKIMMMVIAAAIMMMASVVVWSFIGFSVVAVVLF